MKVFHATPKSNLDSIKQNGLLVSKAKKSCKFVWLHTPSRSHWAILHTSQNHGADWDDVAIIEIDVPRFPTNLAFVCPVFPFVNSLSLNYNLKCRYTRLPARVCVMLYLQEPEQFELNTKPV